MIVMGLMSTSLVAMTEGGRRKDTKHQHSQLPREKSRRHIKVFTSSREEVSRSLLPLGARMDVIIAEVAVGQKNEDEKQRQSRKKKEKKRKRKRLVESMEK